MYTPASFAETDLPKLHGFIRHHSFGVLVSQGDEPTASHLPLLLDSDAGPSGRLLGHMARANPQWRQADGQRVLVVFSGPHAYISPRWYAAEGVVPTWNYVAVHAYGSLRVIDNDERLVQIVQQTVEFYERCQPRPWMLAEVGGLLEKLLPSIVGFEIDISRLEGKWKLGQNHSSNRRENVIEALRQSAGEGSWQIAQLMEETL